MMLERILLMLFFLIQLHRVGSVILYRFAIYFCDDPLFNNASISGRKASSLLLPGPLGLPSCTPDCLMDCSASLVLLLIRSRSISAAIEKTIAITLLCMVLSSCQPPLTV